MRASETVLRNLLQGEKQYVVPLYQRTYSWKRDQLDQLWTDITGLLDPEHDDGHFLGSVVLAPSEANTASGVQSWLVVDGQQRITTLSILLCAIRDYCQEKFPQLARKIDVQYLKNEFAQPPERYTLLPTQADRNAWIDLVERNPKASGEDSVGNAYRFFSGRLVQLLEGEGEPSEYRVQYIEQAVVSRLSFVEISAQAGDNVYRIFESLNNTGLKLTQADLLRNYLFMRLRTNADRVYHQHWLPMQKLLIDQDLVELIKLDLILKGKRTATQDSLYREQQKCLNQLGTEDEVEKWIVELCHKARVFTRVLTPSKELNPRIRGALDRLHRWRATVVYPITLRILLACDDGQLDVQEVTDALRVVESYLVRQLVVGIVRPGSNLMLSDLVKSLRDEIPTAKAITRILTRQRGRFQTDQAMRKAILENPFYLRGKEWQKYSVLRCLEEAFDRAEKIDFEKSKLTIEHILPQKMTDEWERTLRLNLGGYDTIQELHQSIVHTIGNLTLSAHNGNLSNKTFEVKKEILADSGLAMNLEIAKHSNWGVTEIRQRGEELAELAIKIWPGPDDTIPNEPQSPRLADVHQALSEIPSGRWTNYRTIAQVSGTHHRTVSKWLAECSLPNAHRVLKSDGSIPATTSLGLRSQEEQIQKLESEGVVFGANGRAGTKHHLALCDLAKLVGGEFEDQEV